MAAPLRTMGAIEIYHGMNEGGSAMLRTMLVGCEWRILNSLH
jgi:hypothetical protein